VSNLLNNAENLTKDALQALSVIDKAADLKTFQSDFLSKKSAFGALLLSLKELSVEEKRAIAPQVQGLRQQIQEAFNAKQESLQKAELEAKLASDWIDVTKSQELSQGAIHPVAKLQMRVEDIFTSMGFEIGDGPEVETEWNNFDGLNIPPTHPARDMQDTFWIKTGSENTNENTVLRTHTSSLKIRTMMGRKGSIRAIFHCRVYRNEALDATHDAIFYQVEGLLVDKNISLSHLKATIKEMLSRLFEKEIKIRFRPGYFPFVEPGIEVDIWFEYTDKDGNKKAKWLEFMGAGMIHPNVLKNCGINPEEYSGFAFGFGLTRLVMLKYKIDDIRHLFSHKKEFLSQF